MQRLVPETARVSTDVGTHNSQQVAVARLRRLPVLRDFPIDAVPRAPYPNDSELYCASQVPSHISP